ncbi:phasin family protein [soil metagenome]
MFKSLEDLPAFGKEGVDAYVTSATAVTKGLQTIAAQNVDYSRKAFEKGSEAFEKFSTAKTLENVLELQQSYVKEAYEAYLGQINKIGELYLSTAKDAYRPFESKFASFAPSVTK